MSAVASRAAHDQVLELQRSAAGFVTRLSANFLDAIVLCLLWAGGLVLVGFVRFMARPSQGFHLPALPGWVTGVAFTALAVAYLTSGWSATGRSIGKRVAGLRLVTADGQRLSPSRAFLRAVLCVVFPVGFLWALFSVRNRSVHDLIVRTTVIYDWGITIRGGASNGR
jgi:uncharacterized RDD family membrane protein YckC